ncbi:ATP-binding protein [Massilia sp. ZL223]|uniref:sensor histidine kinase n=1 Tax=Massilia sp. ZL223 TaxID=2824904 RepID=UPI001B81679D|nr:ATP-binding protein [Massilia sp. ZL223]MBQ5961954.1 sensor histidine kinase N-terminal domain-containing protein [Massilia sp. ZL223]
MSGRPYSGRRRLVLGTLACILLIFAGIGVGAHKVARHESVELFSARLATSARVLEALVAQQLASATVGRPIVISLPQELETSTSDLPEFFGHRYETKIAFQVWRDGALLVKSAAAPEAPLAPLRPGFSEHDIGGVLWEVFVLRSGDVWIMAAEKEEVREELSEGIGMSILAPLALGALCLLAVLNWLILRSTRPLSELATLIAARKPESLDPVELHAAPLELMPIVTELNKLMDRTRASMEREQRFLNAAAHEIRTPIAAVQLHLENALRAGDEGQRTGSLESALAAARRTSRLTEQLLTLSRISSGGDAAPLERLSLMAVCCDVIGTLEPLLDQRGQSIGLEALQDCHVLGEPAQLRRMLQNLIDNASVHGAAGGDIQVTLARRGQAAVLTVSNDGVPIPEAEIAKLFTPYYRVQGAPAGGFGLGLAIVKEIVDQHGGQVRIRRKPDGQGTVAEISLRIT